MSFEVNDMELAKITSKGQITLPIGVRRSLNLREGGKVAFIEQDGAYTIVNPLSLAIEGEAERLGLKDIDTALTAPKSIRDWVEDLTGIIQNTNIDEKHFKAERLAQKYESLD